MDILIGLDIGTSRIKAVATDLNNKFLSEFSDSTPWINDGSYSSIDVFTLASKAISVAQRAAMLAKGNVLGIGITGFAETGVLISEDDEVLRLGLAWHDTRGLLDSIQNNILDEEFRATTGLSINTTTSIAKTLWIKKNIKKFKDPKHFLSIPEWVAYSLGGALVNEVSLLSRTGFFNILDKKPWDKAIKLVSNSDDFLGRVVLAGEPVGKVSDRHEGLSNAIITIAGHDHLVAAYYCNAIKKDTLFDSIGTAEAILCTVNDKLDGDAIKALSYLGIGVSCSVIDGHYTLIGAMNTGLALDKFFNYLEIFDSKERTEFSKNSNDTNLNLLIKYLIANSNSIINNIESLTGKNKHVVASGGWIKNPILLKEKEAQFADRDFTLALVDEAGAMGAAKFAGISVRRAYAIL